MGIACVNLNPKHKTELGLGVPFSGQMLKVENDRVSIDLRIGAVWYNACEYLTQNTYIPGAAALIEAIPDGTDSGVSAVNDYGGF